MQSLHRITLIDQQPLIIGTNREGFKSLLSFSESKPISVELRKNVNYVWNYLRIALNQDHDQSAKSMLAAYPHGLPTAFTKI